MDDGRGYRATRWKAITPSDTANLEGVYGILSNDGGDIALMGDDGNVEVFVFGVGELKPLAPKRVMDTGTESSDIIGVG